MASEQTAGGAVGGAASGAAVGSLILPGIGTAVGAVVGGVIGGLGGALGDSSAKRSRRARRKQMQAQIEQLLDANEQQLEQSRRLGGRQKASFGAAGILSDKGTAAAVQARTLGDALLNQERILKGVAAIRQQIRAEHRGASAGNLAAGLNLALGGITSGINVQIAGNRNNEVVDPTEDQIGVVQ